MSETPSVKKKGLQPKDLINIGIFTALYFIIIMAVAMLGYVPIFIPLRSVICPLIGGIPY
ncbi:MAG: MptD family putative ECF transporter S component, partial [Prevotella salivae]|nr:MptD family putative ECF transporter S component [Segatella salivae]